MIKNLLYSAFIHVILLLVVYLSFTSEHKIDLNSEEFLISAIIIEEETKKINVPPVKVEKKEIIQPPKEETKDKPKIVEKVKEEKKAIIKEQKEKIEVKPKPKPKVPQKQKEIKEKELKKLLPRPEHKFNPENDLENLNLTTREKFNLKTQFKRCYIWATKESQYKNKIKIKFSINISQYGLVESNISKILDQTRYKEDKDYKKSVDNATRTIELCSPIRNLPNNKFDMLRKINIEIGQ